jgi:hypothetical protein
VYECNREASIMRRSWPTRVCTAMEGCVFMFCIVVTINNNGNNIFCLESFKASIEVTFVGPYCDTDTGKCLACFAQLNNYGITTKRIVEVLQNRFSRFPEPHVYLRCLDDAVMGSFES